MRAIRAQAKSLVEFGYPDVTEEMVAQAHCDWKCGKEPEDIISMFCVSAFEEHTDLFGKPNQ